MSIETPITRLPATNTIEKLRDARDSSTTVEKYLNGLIPASELTPKEREIFDRVMSLNAMRQQFSTANGRKWVRLDRKKLLAAHMERFQISTATADRDLKIVNGYVAKLTESESELRRASLIEALEITLQDAIENGERELVGRLARELKDFTVDKGGALNGIAADRIEQHINIYVADDYTNEAIRKMLEGDVSLHRYLPSLEEVLAAEAEYEELASERLEPVDPPKLLSDEQPRTPTTPTSDS